MIKSKIIDLSCSYFRNFNNIKFSPNSNVIIITGKNGVGKTNFLEAISLLSPGKGLRNAQLQQLSNLGTPDKLWNVEMNVEGSYGNNHVKMYLHQGPEQQLKRKIFVNDIESKSQNELMNLGNVIWIVPQMDGVFIRGTSVRRRWLDKITSNAFANYHSYLGKYEYYVKERSNLLKHQQQNDEWLSIIEQKIAEYGVMVASARVETISMLQNILDVIDYDLPKVNIFVEGDIENQILTTTSLQLEKNFASLLRDSRKLDTLTKRTNVGVHRSDFVVFNKTKNIEATMCSTGEQKILLVAVLLAEVLAFIEKKSVIPILLLDDIMSYLDETKRNMLYTIIRDIGAQTWITGTDREHFSFMQEESDLLEIYNNEVIRLR